MDQGGSQEEKAASRDRKLISKQMLRTPAVPEGLPATATRRSPMVFQQEDDRVCPESLKTSKALHVDWCLSGHLWAPQV